MPTQKPRIALTVPDDLNELLDNLSELMGSQNLLSLLSFSLMLNRCFKLYNTINHAKKFKTVCRL